MELKLARDSAKRRDEEKDKKELAWTWRVVHTLACCSAHLETGVVGSGGWLLTGVARRLIGSLI